MRLQYCSSKRCSTNKFRVQTFPRLFFFVHYIYHLIYVNHDFGQFDDEADVRVDA